MTDFSALLIADDGGPATEITLIGPDGLDAWLATQGERVRTLITAQGFRARADEIAILPADSNGGWVIAAGIADVGDPFALAAAAAKLPAGRYRLRGGPEPEALGWLLAQHRFDRYRQPDDPKGPRVLLTAEPGRITEAARMAEATALVRDLVDTPANDLGPAELADIIAAEARRFGATCDVTIGEALLAANFPAVHAAGRAASRSPRMVDVGWGDPAHPLVAIIGKGVCFDSGGLNIKHDSGMAIMKKDMGGAAHALALARLVMQGNLPVRLRLIVPAVENAISGNAMRPGDIIATRAGKSVEVTNTDAEGRLILADALTLASEARPALMLDFATLTGAARVALGPSLPALFANDDGLAAELLAAGERTRDPAWRMPLHAPYAELLKSPVADLNNSPEGGQAGAVTAALFLQAFVGDGLPWAHFDTWAWRAKPLPARPKGGEALGLRAAWAMLRQRYQTV